MVDKNAKYMAARTGDFSKVQWIRMGWLVIGFPTGSNLYSVKDNTSTNVPSLMLLSMMNINRPNNKHCNSNNRRIATIPVVVDRMCHTTSGPWQDSWLSKHNLPMSWAQHMIMERRHRGLSVTCWMQVMGGIWCCFKGRSIDFVCYVYRSRVSEKCGGFGASSEEASGYGQSCCKGICTPCC